MRPVPVPELIFGGRWDKRNNSRAAVNMTDRQFTAPWDSSPESTAIRVHEYLHLKYSPEKNPTKDAHLGTIMNAFEDERVNYLGHTTCGVDVKPAGNIDINESLTQIDSPVVAAMLYVSSRQYDDPHHSTELLTRMFPKQKDQVDEIIKQLHNNPVFDQTQTCSKNFLELFEEEHKKKEKEKGKGKAGESPREQIDRYFREKESKATPDSDATMNALRKNQQLKDLNRAVLPGKMTIVKVPMKIAIKKHRVKLGTKRKADAFGASFRYPERVLTDKMVFSAPKRDHIGTVLIDCSGSMSISMKMLENVLKNSSGAKIACYSGMGNSGDLVIVAENGKIARGLPHFPGGNIIDVPAMRWLVKQRGPWFWICDGGVTGEGDSLSHELKKICFDIVRSKRVMRFNSLRAFEKAILEGNLKKYACDDRETHAERYEPSLAGKDI